MRSTRQFEFASSKFSGVQQCIVFVDRTLPVFNICTRYEKELLAHYGFIRLKSHQARPLHILLKKVILLKRIALSTKDSSARDYASKVLLCLNYICAKINLPGLKYSNIHLGRC